MNIADQIKKDACFDSVTLMLVGKELAAQPGVVGAVVGTGTPNQAILAASGATK